METNTTVGFSCLLFATTATDHNNNDDDDDHNDDANDYWQIVYHIEIRQLGLAPNATIRVDIGGHLHIFADRVPEFAHLIFRIKFIVLLERFCQLFMHLFRILWHT